MTDNTAAVRAHLAAVSTMLLGNRTLRPSAALLAGERLDPLARLRLGQMACDAQADLVHLTFEEQAGETVMTDISIFVPRDRICFSHPGCRLWLSKTGSRALLLPQPHVRGSFRLAPGEIIHLPFKRLCCTIRARHENAFTVDFYATRMVFGVPSCEKRLRTAARTLSSVI